MKINIFTPHYNAGNRSVLEAFAEGVPGAELHDDRQYRECDVMVLFGLVKKSYAKSAAKGELLRAHRGPIIVIERGYIKRGKPVIDRADYQSETYWSVGLNGGNGLADFCNDNSPPDRWQALGVHLRPWRRYDPTGIALIIGQVPWDTSVQNCDHLGWIKAQIVQARESGLRPLFRPHPYAVMRGVNYCADCMTAGGSLESALSAASVCITQNSNVGVDAIIAGVPTIATDPGSMVWGVSARNISQIANTGHPDRKQWANNIAYAQWTLAEMRRGMAWGHISKGFRDGASMVKSHGQAFAISDRC